MGDSVSARIFLSVGSTPSAKPCEQYSGLNKYMNNKKRVIALMSGGVDSSVAAAILKEQNYDVIGVYILGWTGTAEFPCTWQQEEADARAVAAKLDIPFHTLNLSQQYEKAVIDQFFAGYQEGVTPNPDILCNQEIKFKAVWQAVRQFEPDYIATGHYAKIVNGNIFKPADNNKDQTYFLWGVNKEILPHVLFPLGNMKKPDVRQLAKKLNLITAAKKDSQGICFVGPLKVREFLRSRVKTKPGEAYLVDGRVVARHDGVLLYTIGQRLAAGTVDWTGDVPPLFVLAKDIPNNRLIVGPDSATDADSFTAKQLNWLAHNPLEVVKKAKVRYRQEDIPVNVSLAGQGVMVTAKKPVRAITPGQSVVFYTEDNQLIGGGVIETVAAMEQIINDVTKIIHSKTAAN